MASIPIRPHPLWLRPDPLRPSAGTATPTLAPAQDPQLQSAPGEAEGAAALRRAFRTPPPLMGGGWHGTRGQS